jgi:taurine dioxygenase
MNQARNNTYGCITVTPIAGALGAEIGGVDLSEELSQSVLKEIRSALLAHCVIFFRNQKLSPAEQLRFARLWGEIHLHPFMEGMAEFPEIWRS